MERNDKKASETGTDGNSATELRYSGLHGNPAYFWRGLHMDPCRHFLPMETMRKLIDLMAIYGMNMFHFHLADDQGFRFGSERYPLLREKGAFREGTNVKRGKGEVFDPTPHGGFYTKAELRALVAYAAERGVTIVPELDVPGHSTALLAAYPELACFPRETKVATSFGMKDFSAHILCAGREEVYAFLEGLLDEIMEVFPGEYIHIGGDEAVKSEWKKCPRCQAAMKRAGLADERELQGRMLARLGRHVEGKGRKVIVWNDGLASCTPKSFIAHSWAPLSVDPKGNARTAAHLNGGGKAIMSAFRDLYLDYPYAMTPLEKVFRYKPEVGGLTEEGRANILGVECCLWTEWIESEEKLFFNLLPRLAAVAELAWNGPGGDYRDFVARLPEHYALYERLGLPYAKGMEKTRCALSRLKTAWEFFFRDAGVEVKRR